MAGKGPIRFYALTLLVSAFLLFWVELIVARQLLPLFGGTPGVWTTCLLFFQALVLAGYGYAHFLGRLPTSAQLWTHGLLLGAAALVLPVGVSAQDPGALARSPLSSLLVLLTVVVGLPFLVTAASAPLLQAWYARLGREDSADPYPLYAASNLGSLLALLCYPLLLEPLVGLGVQSQVWGWCFGGLALALLGCGVMTLRAPPAAEPASEPQPAPDRKTRVRWLIRSFVPACLLYGITTVLTTDFAPSPLLWVLPLALYLLSFVVAFRFRRRVPRNLLAGFLAVLLMVMIGTHLLHVTRYPPVWFWFALHLGGVYLASVLLHRDLVDERPPAEHLTGYYLWIAGGGLLAGAFCALAGPLLFESIIEYGIGLLLTLLLLRDDTGTDPVGKGGRRWVVNLSAFAMGVTCITLLMGSTWTGFRDQLPGYALLLVLGALVGFAFPFGKIRAFHLVLFGVLFGQCNLDPSKVIARERSFFGLHRVVESHGLRHYLSGATVHGRQSLDPEQARVPRAYYAPGAPLGQALTETAPITSAAAPRRVAVIGLGIGTLAAYSEPGERWRFFEVDPVCEQIARDPQQFTYLRDARGEVDVVLGDGRLSLAEEGARGEPLYDLILLDAFSSDAIPTHLLTVEAFDVYLSRLAPDGVLVANVSNRFLDLPPLLGAVAEQRGLTGVERFQPVDALSREQREAGDAPTHAVVLSRQAAALRRLQADSRWKPLTDQRVRAWTDDHADLLSVLR